MPDTFSTASYSLAMALAFSLAATLAVQAGGGRPHQNFGVGMPQQCATLQSGTPGYRDCMASSSSSSKVKTVNTDTQLKAQPNSSSAAVGVLNKGTQVAMIERTANGFWCHVESGGFSGYVPFEALN